MHRRLSYALTAGMLCFGPPANFPAVRFARPLLFALLGYMLGRKADELAGLSETDALTSLLNARGFGARLRSELKRAKRYREPLSLLFLDVDGLKDINDRHGHRAGSEALREVAGVIRRELRESDTGARWGGDEFTIIAPKTTKDAAVQFAERIRASIEEHVSEWPITASIGIGSVDWSDADVEADANALMRDADAAMYEAKRRGKNTVAAARKNFTSDQKTRRSEEVYFS